MHTLVGKLVALSVKILYGSHGNSVQLKYVGFMAPLARKVPDPWSKGSQTLKLFEERWSWSRFAVTIR